MCASTSSLLCSLCALRRRRKRIDAGQMFALHRSDAKMENVVFGKGRPSGELGTSNFVIEIFSMPLFFFLAMTRRMNFRPANANRVKQTKDGGQRVFPFSIHSTKSVTPRNDGDQEEKIRIVFVPTSRNLETIGEGAHFSCLSDIERVAQRTELLAMPTFRNKLPIPWPAHEKVAFSLSIPISQRVSLGMGHN